jgi:hypothetical protein
VDQARTHFCDDILAARLLTAVAKGMCSLVYNRQWHKDRAGVIEEDDYDSVRQAEARVGALCAHSCMASYERITSIMEQWGIIEKYRGDVYKLTFDSDRIAELLEKSSCSNSELLFDAIRAFLNFDFQPGWPNAHFPSSLVFDFVQAGVLEGSRGDLIWAPDILFLDGILRTPWDPDPLFDRICSR